jgi:hypothetical protein
MKMKQKQNSLGIELVFVGVAALALLAYISLYVMNSSPTGEITRVCSGAFCFQVEIADTPAEREVGLMNRTQLDENQAMLFVFEQEGLYAFWMKDTLIPLDIIWIDHNWRITYLARDMQPCVSNPCPIFEPGVPALYVLEASAGSADRLGLKTGSRLSAK